MRPERCICCSRKFIFSDLELKLDADHEIIFCPDCQIGFSRLTQTQETERQDLDKSLYNLLVRLETYFGRMIEFNRRYEQCFSMISRHAKVSSALDIGCNIGYFLYFLRKNRINDLAGIETNDKCRAAGQELFGLKIYEDVSAIDQTFDLIIFNDVLEHINDPIHFLKNTFPLAHSATIYFIQLPNYQSSMAKWLGTKWPWWSVPDHLWHFSPAGIIELLKRVGLTIVELKTCDTMYDLIEYVFPQWSRPLMRPLRYVHRTSGYIYRRTSKGGLIQVLAKKE